MTDLKDTGELKRSIRPYKGASDLADSDESDAWKPKALIGRFRRRFDAGPLVTLKRLEVRAPWNDLNFSDSFLFRISFERGGVNKQAAIGLPSDPRKMSGIEVLELADFLVEMFEQQIGEPGPDEGDSRAC